MEEKEVQEKKMVEYMELSEKGSYNQGKEAYQRIIANKITGIREKVCKEKINKAKNCS